MPAGVVADAGPLIALARLNLLEERGRDVARELGLVVRGTLGILAHAYREGIIDADELRLHFEQIEADPNLWISHALCQEVLADVLETSAARKPRRSSE